MTDVRGAASGALPAPEPAAAHRAPDGRFRNPWPGVEERGVRDLLRWRRERRRAPRTTPRVEVLPDAVAPAFVSPHAPADAVTATWVGHSTVLLQIGGWNVLTDPIWSERASPIPWLGPRRHLAPGVALAALPPIDLVVLSHNHYDHLDASTVRVLAARHAAARWFVPLGLAPTLRRFGARQVTELDWWEDATAGPLRVGCTPAQHFSARTVRDRRRSLWSGWTLRAGSRAAFFAGDTGYHPEFAAIAARYGPFDLALLPIGAYEPRWFMWPVHLDPDDVVRVTRDLLAPRAAAPPPTVLGIHWGTFRLTDEPLDEPPVRLRAAWRAASLPEDRLWIPRPGETRLFPMHDGPRRDAPGAR